METLQNLFDEYKIKGHFSIGQVHDFTEKCFMAKSSFDEFEDERSTEQVSRIDAYKLAREVIVNPSNGTPDHYHNYAVTFARASDFDIACDILLCGMKRYHKNVDLLADYLEYAIKSSNDEHYTKCEEIFNVLISRRPDFWNWRAYDFSIDYLLDKLDRGIGESLQIKQQCIELAREFQSRISTNELGYIAEANVYKMFGEEKQAFATLKKALGKTKLHTVQASVTLAEMYIKRNEPQEALKCINRVLSDVSDTNLRIAPSHIYVLSVICKASILLSNVQSNSSTGGIINNPLVQEILNDWDKVKKFGSREHQLFDSAESVVKLIEAISDVNSEDEI